MNIAFSSDSLREQCMVERERIRTFGKIRGKALGRRLDDLAAAETLSAMRPFPEDAMSSRAIGLASSQSMSDSPTD